MCHECTTFLPCHYISFSGGANVRPSHILYMPKASHSLFISVSIFISVNVPTSPLCLNVYYHGFGSGSKRVSCYFSGNPDGFGRLENPAWRRDQDWASI